MIITVHQSGNKINIQWSAVYGGYKIKLKNSSLQYQIDSFNEGFGIPLTWTRKFIWNTIQFSASEEVSDETNFSYIPEHWEIEEQKFLQMLPLQQRLQVLGNAFHHQLWNVFSYFIQIEQNSLNRGVNKIIGGITLVIHNTYLSIEEDSPCDMSNDGLLENPPCGNNT